MLDTLNFHFQIHACELNSSEFDQWFVNLLVNPTNLTAVLSDPTSLAKLLSVPSVIGNPTFTQKLFEYGTWNKATANKIIDGANGSSGSKALRFVGNTGVTVAGVSSGKLTIYDWPHWRIGIDMTDVSTIEFYARRVNAHGSIAVYVDTIGSKLAHINYAQVSTAWTKYQFDMSGYTGNRVLIVCGGYIDSTGATNSETHYSDIKFNY